MLALHGGEKRIPDHPGGDAAALERCAAIGELDVHGFDVLDPLDGTAANPLLERKEKRVHAAAAFLRITQFHRG